jgi:hypothetical protein
MFVLPSYFPIKKGAGIKSNISGQSIVKEVYLIHPNTYFEKTGILLNRFIETC